MCELTCRVLLENTGAEGLACEHGLAFHITYGGQSILLDSGSSGAFAGNATKLGVDLTAVDWAALSHGHYDHADGLRALLAVNDHAPIYMRESAGESYFSISKTPPKFVGIHRDLWQTLKPRAVLLGEGFSPADGVWLLPETVHGGSFASQEKNLVRKDGVDFFTRDAFDHEQSLVFETQDGLVLFNSCCHGGVVNIVRGVMDQLPGKTVTTVVGGMHMLSPGANDLNCPPEYVHQVADALVELGVQRVYTGHCTGATAFGLLQERLGDSLVALSGGLTINL